MCQLSSVLGSPLSSAFKAAHDGALRFHIGQCAPVSPVVKSNEMRRMYTRTPALLC